MYIVFYYLIENVSDLESDESEDLASEDITSSSELENSTVEVRKNHFIFNIFYF